MKPVRGSPKNRRSPKWGSPKRELSKLFRELSKFEGTF